MPTIFDRLRKNSRPIQEIKQPERDAVAMLAEVGLTPADLENKAVLDVGANVRKIEQFVLSSGISTDITSLDIDAKLLAREFTGGKPIAGDIREGFPFLDASFDLVVVLGAPISADPYDPNDQQRMLDALRILKPGGEIRFNNPFTGRGGIARVVHDLESDGKIQRPHWPETEQELRDSGQVDFDDRGRPTLERASFYWRDIFRVLPPDTQHAIMATLLTDLRAWLAHIPYPTDTELHDVTSPNHWIKFYLTITKLSDT